MLHGYGASLLAGASTTLALALAAFGIALLLGLLGASARLSRRPLPRLLAQVYTTLVRAAPDLVLMLLVFYGGQMLVNEAAQALGWDYLDLDPFIAGVLTIGFIFGAYIAEVFRGAYLAVPPGQAEAAQAYGMGRWLSFRRIIAPQLLRHALPGLSNNFLVLLKSTAIVSVIGLSDLMNRAAQAAGATREPFLFYGAVALAYLCFTMLAEALFALLNRRLAIGVKRVAL